MLVGFPDVIFQAVEITRNQYHRIAPDCAGSPANVDIFRLGVFIDRTDFTL